jgi:hypothetical protein
VSGEQNSLVELCDRMLRRQEEHQKQACKESKEWALKEKTMSLFDFS